MATNEKGGGVLRDAHNDLLGRVGVLDELAPGDGEHYDAWVAGFDGFGI